MTRTILRGLCWAWVVVWGLCALQLVARVVTRLDVSGRARDAGIGFEVFSDRILSDALGVAVLLTPGILVLVFVKRAPRVPR